MAPPAAMPPSSTIATLCKVVLEDRILNRQRSGLTRKPRHSLAANRAAKRTASFYTCIATNRLIVLRENVAEYDGAADLDRGRSTDRVGGLAPVTSRPIRISCACRIFNKDKVCPQQLRLVNKERSALCQSTAYRAAAAFNSIAAKGDIVQCGRSRAAPNGERAA